MMEFYNNMVNPLDDVNAIRMLINTVSSIDYRTLNPSFFEGNYKHALYNKIIEKKQGKKVQSDRTMIRTFNKWLKNIKSMSDEYAEKIARYWKVDSEILKKVRDKLQFVVPVQNIEELINLENSLREFEEKYDRISYCYIQKDAFVHLCSGFQNFHPEEINTSQFEHRLYLNIPSDIMDTFINLLLDKYEKYNIPYYFKYDINGDRVDSIVIYSSTKYLEKNINFLKEIKLENPLLFKNIGNPPLLTGKLDSWIGYGSEDSTHKVSYSVKRCHAIQNAISDYGLQWFRENMNKIISIENKSISVREYIINKCSSKFINELEETGYNKITLNTIRRLFEEKLRQELSVERIINGQNVGFMMYKDNVEIKNTSTGKVLKFEPRDYLDVVVSEIKNIEHFDPNFLTSIRKEIDKNLQKDGVDTQKFCFDQNIVTKLKRLDIEKKKQEYISLKETFLKYKANASLSPTIESNGIDEDELPKYRFAKYWSEVSRQVSSQLNKTNINMNYSELNIEIYCIIVDLIRNYVDDILNNSNDYEFDYNTFLMDPLSIIGNKLREMLIGLGSYGQLFANTLLKNTEALNYMVYYIAEEYYQNNRKTVK